MEHDQAKAIGCLIVNCPKNSMVLILLSKVPQVSNLIIGLPKAEASSAYHDSRFVLFLITLVECAPLLSVLLLVLPAFGL